MDDDWFLSRLALATVAAFFGGTALFLFTMRSPPRLPRRIIDIFDNEVELEIEGVIEADTSFPSPLGAQLIVEISVDVAVRSAPGDHWHDTVMRWRRCHGLRISDGTGTIVIPESPSIGGAPKTSIVLDGEDVPSMILTGLRERYGDVASDFAGKQVRLAVRQIPVGFKVRAQCRARRVDGKDTFEVHHIVSADTFVRDDEPSRPLAAVFTVLFVGVTLAFFGTLVARFGVHLW